LRQNRGTRTALASDADDDRLAEIAGDPAEQPDVQFLRAVDRQLLREGLEALPTEFREVLVLRELEGFSYKEIADIADVPLGTVMSRLARARKQLQQSLVGRMKEGV
jgi:RNA polymerase sigma-70 factor (ECF subfamily)